MGEIEMAGPKITGSVPTREWLRDQSLLPEKDRDPQFVKLYPRLQARARTLAQGLVGNTDPARARMVADIFEEAAAQVASDRTAESTLHIRELVQKWPSKTAKELRKLADKSKLGGMTDHTFEKKVSAAKKLAGK